MEARADDPSTLTLDSELRVGVLAPELARLPQVLGLQSLRAFRVDTQTLACLTACRIGGAGELGDLRRPGLLDSVFPGGAALLERLAPQADQPPMVLRNSPRRWVAAWSEGPRRAVLLAVHSIEGQELSADRHGELLRALASAALREAEDRQAASDDSPEPAWPRVDRRARGRPSPATWVGLAGAAAALLVSLWLSLWAMPAAEDQVRVQELAATKGREQAERTLTSSLSNAVVTGDYGEVQNMLTFYGSLGYVEAAAVLNARGKVVAMVGAPGSLQMGAEPGREAIGQFDSVSLGQGDNRGQLLRPAAAPLQPAAITIHLARFLSVAAALGSALALGVLARPLWQAWRRPAAKAKRR